MFHPALKPRLNLVLAVLMPLELFAQSPSSTVRNKTDLPDTAGQLIPGAVWLDTEKKPIQAHGGGVLFHEGFYYWYGENKDGPTSHDGGCGARTPVLGISAYKSKDLTTWKNLGVVLQPVPEDPSHDLHTDNVLERPKVIYNASTKSFVMWMHVDHKKYTYARAGVAVADSPAGPFTYLGAVRPDGQESRDMTLFKDDDGSAWLI